jgi:hypothetical protein
MLGLGSQFGLGLGWLVLWLGKAYCALSRSKTVTLCSKSPNSRLESGSDQEKIRVKVRVKG